MHKHREINYGAKTQYNTNADNSNKLDNKGIKRIQSIMVTLLYYARAVNTKLLVSLRDIGSQQVASTENPNETI